jgi:hypothetical protein
MRVSFLHTCGTKGKNSCTPAGPGWSNSFISPEQEGVILACYLRGKGNFCTPSGKARVIIA